MNDNVPTWIPNAPKAYETLCLLRERIGRTATPTRLVSALMLAERYHITEYGRMIYGEHWTMAWHGPRPTVLSAILSGDPYALDLIGTLDGQKLLDIGEAGAGSTVRRRPVLEIVRKPDMTKLSASDVEAVDLALSIPPENHPQYHDVRALLPQGLRPGDVIHPADLLDPQDPDHAEKRARLLEDVAYIAY